jgi:hypothetical protein
MVILPEHTHEQARQVMAGALAQAVKARYFPMGRGAQPLDDKSLGKPLGEWGCLHMGVASLDGEASAGALLAGAKAELESSEVNRV